MENYKKYLEQPFLGPEPGEDARLKAAYKLFEQKTAKIEKIKTFAMFGSGICFFLLIGVLSQDCHGELFYEILGVIGIFSAVGLWAIAYLLGRNTILSELELYRFNDQVRSWKDAGMPYNK
ncbi:hypothetical protein OAR29_01085 [Rhodospirillales bacterium]|nr:hypothetical protein [Rhodospirillales bacterium]